MKQKSNLVKKESYEDYSSGRVLYGVPGATNFSVKLSNEIFELCAQYFSSKGKSAPYTIYDPFCGAAYSLTVLGLFHGKEIKAIYASDVDKKILDFAKKNLSLLSTEGILKRIKELENFIKEYKKVSHQEALDSAFRLKTKVDSLSSIRTECFYFNILTDSRLPFNLGDIDLIMADVPYGKLTSWHGHIEGENPIQVFLNKVKEKLSQTAVVAIIVNKKQLMSHEGYERIKKFTHGKRKIVLLKPN